MGWQPVKRSDQQVTGTDPRYSALVIVEVTLSPNPPGDWIGVWNPYPPNSSYSWSYGPPSLSGNKITLRVPDASVKEAVEMLDGQIAAANRWYDEQVIPRREAAEERARQEREDEGRRLEEVQRQLDELGQPNAG